VRRERLIERATRMSLGQRRERAGVAPVAQGKASLAELPGAQQSRAGRPGGSVARRRVGSELRAQRDQLGQVGDGLDAADLRDPDEAVRVEVVAEQKRGVGVAGSKRRGRP